MSAMINNFMRDTLMYLKTFYSVSRTNIIKLFLVVFIVAFIWAIKAMDLKSMIEVLKVFSGVLGIILENIEL